MKRVIRYANHAEDMKHYDTASLHILWLVFDLITGGKKKPSR
jgi:hypothetical protein